jgi:hypothetical protein
VRPALPCKVAPARCPLCLLRSSSWLPFLPKRTDRARAPTFTMTVHNTSVNSITAFL